MLLRGVRRIAGRGATALLRAVGRRRTALSVEHVLASARAVMRSRRYCTFVTSGPEGPSARVVEPRGPEEDLTLWVGTSPGSRKAREATSSASALLVFESHRDRAAVVARCRVEAIEDPEARRRWFAPSWRLFWPAGPRSDDFVLLRCVPEVLEVWDARRGVTPEPLGLRSARLVRRGAGWAVD